jgi:hypothetical protein
MWAADVINHVRAVFFSAIAFLPFASSTRAVSTATLSFKLPSQFCNPVNVGEIGSVAPDSNDLAADLSNRLVQFRWATAGYKHVCTFGREAFGTTQADARAAACDYCHFVSKFLVHNSFHYLKSRCSRDIS